MPPDKESDTTSLLNKAAGQPPTPDPTPKKRGLLTRLFSSQRAAGDPTKEPMSLETTYPRRSDDIEQHNDTIENHYHDHSELDTDR